MAFSIDINNIPDSGRKEAVNAMLTDLFQDRPGDWHMSIIASQANDRWEITITGTNEFEWRHYFGGPGEHNPSFIRSKIEAALENGV